MSAAARSATCRDGRRRCVIPPLRKPWYPSPRL